VAEPTPLVEPRSGERQVPGSTMFESPVVRAGRFRCPVSHPRFRDSGPTNHYTFAFPRTSVWIHHGHCEPFITDTTTVTMYNPSQRYERRPNDPRGDLCEWVEPSAGTLRGLVGAFDRASADEPTDMLKFPWGPIAPERYLEQRRLYEYLVREPVPDVLRVEESAVSVLGGVLQDVYDARNPTRRREAAIGAHHRRLVEGVRAYLSRTFREPQSLATISERFNVSAFHLCRLFRACSGTTIHAYLNQLRLRLSLERLLDPGTDILALALELGYSSHSHFTSAFRRCYGCRPSAWRQLAARKG